MDADDAEIDKMVGDILSEGHPAWPPLKAPEGGWPEVDPPPVTGEEWKGGDVE